MNSLNRTNFLPEVIIQFGICANLQAHANYFIGDSIARGESSAKIIVVDTDQASANQLTIKKININPTYWLHIQGVQEGKLVDQLEAVNAYQSALCVKNDWDRLVDLFCFQASHVLSSSGDDNFSFGKTDHSQSLLPQSYPAQLLSLLIARHNTTRMPISIFPCESIPQNGKALKKQVLKLAKKWRLPKELVCWIDKQCIWVNSVLDRIAIKSFSPLSTVTEPYALWAIEAQQGLTLPCSHKNIRLVDSVNSIEWLKFGLLNLSQVYLVHLWVTGEYSHIKTVFDAIEHHQIQQDLNELLQQEVIPVLEAMNLTEDVQAYATLVLERFYNPYLDHQLCELAQNHQAKMKRYILPIYHQGTHYCSKLAMPKLKQCLNYHAIAV